MKYLKMLGLAAVAAMALTAFTAGSASATTLEQGGVTQNKSVALTASLEPDTTLVLANTEKTLSNTCKKGAAAGATEIVKNEKGETISTFTGTQVTGKLTELTFEECTHNPVTVEAGGLGQLFVRHIAGTTNGTVFAENQKVTVPTSLPGTAHVTCATAATGTHIGTLTGVKSGNATMHINAVLNCGFLLPSAIWEGKYIVTTPSGAENGLGVSA